jgi:hypothetical protein
MKYSAKQIIVLFNKSKSGKSYINVSGDVMTIVPATVYDMCKNGEIEEVEVEAGEPLMDETDNTKVVFNTMKVKSFSESALAKLEKAKRFMIAAEGFDSAKFTEIMKMADAITF